MAPLPATASHQVIHAIFSKWFFCMRPIQINVSKDPALDNEMKHSVWTPAALGASVEFTGTVTVRKVWDGRGVLIGPDTLNGKAILVRAMWSDIKADSHRYEESYSMDGGTTWVRSFIANLTRLK
jgi:hypothetical protein